MVTGWGLRAVLLGIVALGVLATGAASSWISARRLLIADPNAIVADAPLFSAAVTEGREIYRNHCASCHGKVGEGDPGLGVPALGDHEWIYGTGTPAEIERIVTYGIRSHHPKTWNLAAMPAFATAMPSPTQKLNSLSPGQIADVSEYLMSLRGEPADPAAAARGASVYGGPGVCNDCHAADARGDSAIGAPGLMGPSWIYGDGSRQALSASIAQGRHGVCPAWIDRLNPTAIREVAMYIYALSRPMIRGASR